MHKLCRKWVSRITLLVIVFSLFVTFTAVVQAGGGNEPTPPPKAGPPTGMHPGAKPFPVAVQENCIGAFTYYDGNQNGMYDANEGPMDGASVVLMVPGPPPPTDPPIGPDGKPILPLMGSPYGKAMPMERASMGPPPEAKMPPMMPPEEGIVQFKVVDRLLTRDGGIAVFCDLKPGSYILQGDAANGITYGDNRQYTELSKGSYAVVSFGFSRLNGLLD